MLKSQHTLEKFERNPTVESATGNVSSLDLKTDLGIVIVSWNTRELLRRCLTSIFESQGDIQYTVCVVDNASSDGSAQMVAEAFPQVHLIESGSNLGYPKANNLGLCWMGFRAEVSTDMEDGFKAPPRYALLLNPDTEVPPLAFTEMIHFMDDKASAAIAGPCLRRPDGQIDKACRRSFPTPQTSFYRHIGLSRLFPKSKRFNAYNLEYLPEDAVHPVDAVVGAYMQVRAEAIEEVGLLDETFFMYGEDLDWAKRFIDAGWQIWYNGEVEVLHVKEAASSQTIKSRIDFHEAMWIFYRKHYQQQTSRIANWLIMFGVVALGGLDVAKHLWRYCRST
ncbi:MAG: glycosyltransferase family 2 protein [Chloroflexota bacterium]